MIEKTTSEGFLCTACVLTVLLAGQMRISADTNASVVVTLSDPLISLRTPVWTNGEVHFALNGESNVSYVIESSSNLLHWTPVATNNATFTTVVAASGSSGFYRASRKLLPLSCYAVAVRSNLILNGTQLVTDSFNSSDTNSSTDGRYDSAKASTNGNVACVAGVVVYGNHIINGSLYLGPGAWCSGGPSGRVTGTINYNYPLNFPDVVLSPTDSDGKTISWLPVTAIGGTNYFFANGNYFGNDSNPIYVLPGVTATFLALATNFNPRSVTIGGGMTNSGTLVIYQASGSAKLGGNVSGGSTGNRPQNFVFCGLPGVTNITLTQTSYTNFVGVIYAPSASISLSGKGSIVGSCIVGTMIQNSYAAVHFDESLLTSGPMR